MIDDAHLAHGLAGDQLTPDWPPLVANEVSSVVERIPGLGALRVIEWRSPRPLSAAALVATANGRVFVKRHHRSVRTEATLSEEHRFAAHLRERGVPMRARAGQQAQRDGDHLPAKHLHHGPNIIRTQSPGRAL